ncbi:hypothetical protein HO422_05880 [Streptococcus suis]|nr:hypothetical protein [Streptococcus suis]
MDFIYFKEVVLNQDYKFYFDTNTFLSLYRKDEETVDRFSENIKSINNDIRIPSTVVGEYERNVSDAKIYLQKELKKSINSFPKNVSEKIRTSLNQISEQLVDNESTVIEKFKHLQKQVLEKVSETEEFLKSLEIEENTIKIEKVSELISDFLIVDGNKLPPITMTEQIKYMNEGYTRAKHHFPPGYMDMKEKYHGLKKEANKRNQGQKKPSELIRYLGDYFIWSEIIKDVHDKNALFITSDLKEDWWEIPDKKFDLSSYEPRTELSEEFSEITNKNIEFIPFDLFISFLESVNNQELLQNYLFQNISELESLISNRVIDFVGGNENIIISENDIIWDSDITRGYVPYNHPIEVQDKEITSVEIEGITEGDDGSFSVELDVRVNVYGIFEVSSGLEGDIYRHVDGDFSQEGIAVSVIISFTKDMVLQVQEIRGSTGEEDYSDIIEQAEIESIDLTDSGLMVLDYEDPDEKHLEEYYQWAWDRDEERHAKW